jgi:hypothetical protein
MISPQEFKVSEKLIRKRLGISHYTTIVPFGYEEVLNENILSILKKRFDTGSLFIRTRPDFFVIDKDELYFVEAKQRTKNVEAIQLLYNKFYERWGIKVIYSFPEVAINASVIPMEKIIIPENYREEFDTHLKFLFEAEGITDFAYVRHVTNGSGDAFVPIDLDDLKLLADELVVQESFN